MKILMVNVSDHALPPPPTVIRADTYISIPLATELQRRGHEVFFLCPRGSKIKIKKIFSNSGAFVSVINLKELNTIDDMGIRTELLWTFHLDLYLKLLEVVKSQHFDIIHLHTNIPTMEIVITNRLNTPCVMTLHWIPRFPTFENRVISIFNKKQNNYFVSLSNAQRKNFTSISFTKTIYNAIDVSNFKFNRNNKNHLIFVGRLKKSKGVKEALEAAIKTRKKLQFAGSVSMSYSDQNYLKNEVMPLVKKYPEFLTRLPFIQRKNLSQFYGNGKATLLPIQWEEPFGLVMIESMATGTPVIAFARGSVPEVIKDGGTGFIINPSNKEIRGKWIIKKTGINGICEAINRIYSLSEKEYQSLRENCRKHVEKKFSIKRMVNDYEELYKNILKEDGKKTK